MRSLKPMFYVTMLSLTACGLTKSDVQNDRSGLRNNQDLDAASNEVAPKEKTNNAKPKIIPTLKDGVAVDISIEKQRDGFAPKLALKKFDGSEQSLLVKDKLNVTNCERASDCQLQIDLPANVKGVYAKLADNRIIIALQDLQRLADFDPQQANDLIISFDCIECKSLTIKQLSLHDDASCLNYIDLILGHAASCVAGESP